MTQRSTSAKIQAIKSLEGASPRKLKLDMVLNHIHLQVRDLSAAINWVETVLRVHPGFHNERMATFSFNSLILIFDAANNDTPATVGFESDDCDRDFQAIVDRGAVALEPPTNKDWGVRSAYFKGPGALKFEIEGPIAND